MEPIILLIGSVLLALILLINLIKSKQTMKEISLSYRDICFYSLAIIAIICAFCLFMIILDIAQIFFIKQFCLTAGFFIFAVSICYALFGDDTKYHDILSTMFIIGGFIILCLSAYVCSAIDLIQYE